MAASNLKGEDYQILRTISALEDIGLSNGVEVSQILKILDLYSGYDSQPVSMTFGNVVNPVRPGVSGVHAVMERLIADGLVVRNPKQKPDDKIVELNRGNVPRKVPFLFKITDAGKEAIKGKPSFVPKPSV